MKRFVTKIGSPNEYKKFKINILGKFQEPDLHFPEK